MGEEEKEEQKNNEESGGEGSPDVGNIPGGFVPGGGSGIFLSTKLIAIISPIVVILIIALSIGMYYFGKNKALYKDGQIRKSTKYMGTIYPLKEIKTNILNDSYIMKGVENKYSNKILEIKINLVLNNDKAIYEINDKYPQIIDYLLMMIHKKSYEDLNSISDQNKFKRQIRDELNDLLSAPYIKEVYFEKFRILPIKPVEIINWDENK